MPHRNRIRASWRLLFPLWLVLPVALVSPVLAEPVTVTTTVRPHTLPSATIEELVLPEVRYSRSDQWTSGSTILTVDALDASQVGWTIRIQVGSLENTTLDCAPIPAAGLMITDLGTPIRVGEPTSDHGPKTPSVSLPMLLDVPQIVLVAEANAGNGVFTQKLAIALLIPGGTLPGRYVAEIVVTVGTDV